MDPGITAWILVLHIPLPPIPLPLPQKTSVRHCLAHLSPNIASDRLALVQTPGIAHPKRGAQERSLARPDFPFGDGRLLVILI
jgi:hypothetical protein